MKIKHILNKNILIRQKSGLIPALNTSDYLTNNFALTKRTFFNLVNFIKNRRGKKLDWINVEYHLDSVEKTITFSLINKMINKLWSEQKFKELDTNKKYLIILARVRLASGDIKTITKLQKLSFNSKEFLKEFVTFKGLTMHDFYKDSSIKSFIFSFGTREFKYLKSDFIDTVIEETKPAITQSLTHNFKTYKLPISTDLNLWGKIITDLKAFKSIDLGKNKLINISINEDDGYTYYECQLFKNNKLKISWKDKIVDLEKDHLIRTIEKTVIDYNEGKFVYSRTVLAAKFIEPLKPKKETLETIQNKIISADFETVKVDNQMVPYLAAFSLNKQPIKNIFDSNPSRLFTYFFNSLLTRKMRGKIIYFHNLSGFDGFFLLRKLVDGGLDVKPLIHNGKLISIKAKKGKDTWTFNDSALLLLQSLKSLSKSFGLEISKGIFPYNLSDLTYKGSFPDYSLFDKVSIEDWHKANANFKNKIWSFKIEAITYCTQDVKVLHEILNSFAHLVYKTFGISINTTPTIPSLAFKIYRSIYMPKDKIAIINGVTDKEIRKGYTGGSTEMFIPSFNVLEKTDKKLYAYDVNSLYPSVMAQNLYPVGAPNALNFGDGVDLVNAPLDLFGHFYAEIISPDNLSHPILQVKYNSRTVSPLGVLSGWFYSEELKNAIKFGYKIKIIRGYQFERGMIFDKYVHDLYKMRLNYPKSDPMNLVAKLLLNSLYGRFGMGDLGGDTQLVDSKTFLEWTEDQKKDIEDIITFGSKILLRYKNLLSLNTELIGSTTNTNIAVASAVTAYARIFMSQFKNREDLPNLYYTDTDSLYFDGPIPDSMVNDTKLGALKLEGIYDQAIFLAPKLYALKNYELEIIKIKGLSKVAIKDTKITFDVLKMLLASNTFMDSKQTKWFKDLSNGTIRILEQSYSIKATGNKRTLVYKDNTLIGTHPFKINMINP